MVVFVDVAVVVDVVHYFIFTVCQIVSVHNPKSLYYFTQHAMPARVPMYTVCERCPQTIG